MWWEEEGEGEIYGESTKKFTIPCVKQIANGNLLYDSGIQTGALQQAEGWVGEGDRREAQEGGDTGVPMADFC